MSEPNRQYFEDIQVGDEYVSPGRTVTEADIVAFAGLSGRLQRPPHRRRVHEDLHLRGAHRARPAGPVRSRPASDRAPIVRPFATMAFLGLRWRFKGPIKIGDTIKVRMRVSDKKETSKPDRGIVTVQRVGSEPARREPSRRATRSS